MFPFSESSVCCCTPFLLGYLFLISRISMSIKVVYFTFAVFFLGSVLRELSSIRFLGQTKDCSVFTYPSVVHFIFVVLFGCFALSCWRILVFMVATPLLVSVFIAQPNSSKLKRFFALRYPFKFS